MVVVVIPNPFGFDRSVVGDGTGFILSCVDFGRIFDDSFPTCGFFFFASGTSFWCFWSGPQLVQVIRLKQVLTSCISCTPLLLQAQADKQTHTHTYTNAYTQAHTHTHTYSYTHTHTHTHIHTTDTYKDTQTHRHTHTHTPHIHIRARWSSTERCSL